MIDLLIPLTLTNAQKNLREKKLAQKGMLDVQVFLYKSTFTSFASDIRITTSSSYVFRKKTVFNFYCCTYWRLRDIELFQQR